MSYNFNRDWTANPNTGLGPPSQPPGYNNPWYDPQLQGQIGQQGSFQPMPQDPYDNSPIWNTMPVQGDYFGGQGMGFGNYNPQGIGATIMPVDPMGQGGQFPNQPGNGSIPELLNRSGVGSIDNPQVGGVQMYPPDQTATGASSIGVMPGMNSVDPMSILGPAISQQKQAELDKQMIQPNLPTQPQQNYSNLYGGFGQGWQQGFNELNNKQFTSGSDAYNQAFGSTGGAGLGNNYNWNIFPNLVSPVLNDAFKQAAIQVSLANPDKDFEPTMIDGQWVLAARPKDQASQIALLKPQLPTTPTGGSGGAGARISSGGGYPTTYGKSNNTGGVATPNLPTKAQLAAGANSLVSGGAKAIQMLKDMGQQQGPLIANPPTVADYYGIESGQAQPTPQTPNPWGGGNQPYVPVTGTGTGYTPLNPNIPQPAPYVPPSNNGRRLEDQMPPKTYIGPGPTGVAPGVPGDYDGQISPDGLYIWGARGQYWYKR